MTDLLAEILKQVKSAAEAGDALALGANAVHNLWQAIQALGTETNSEPTPGLLISMAIRMDHGLGIPGYYDQPMFGSDGPTHKQRLDAALSTARQMWEEATGRGFYRPEKEAEYVKRAEDSLIGKRHESADTGTRRLHQCWCGQYHTTLKANKDQS